MYTDFGEIDRLYKCAERIARSKSWKALTKVVGNYKGLLEKAWDMERLEAIYNRSIDDAKLKVLADPAFLILVKVHSGKVGKDGCSTNRYCEVFDRITEEKTEVALLQKEFGLKDFVFIQHARFDPFPERGTTYTKTFNGKKMIWREK